MMTTQDIKIIGALQYLNLIRINIVLLHYQTLSVHAQTNLTMRMTESVKGIEGGGYVP